MRKVRVQIVPYQDRRNLALRYRCPVTGRRVQRTAGTPNYAEAKVAAKAWEEELNEGGYEPEVSVLWSTFRRDFTDHYLIDRSRSVAVSYLAAFDDFEDICKPGELSDITPDLLDFFRRGLRARGYRGDANENRLNRVLVALRWAHREGLVRKEIEYAV